MKHSVLLVTVVLSLLSITGLIHAQNSMPIMQTFVGKSGHSWFGEALVAFDFNADGYDDLFIHSRNAQNGWPGVMLFNLFNAVAIRI